MGHVTQVNIRNHLLSSLSPAEQTTDFVGMLYSPQFASRALGVQIFNTLVTTYSISASAAGDFTDNLNYNLPLSDWLTSMGISLGVSITPDVETEWASVSSVVLSPSQIYAADFILGISDSNGIVLESEVINQIVGNCAPSGGLESIVNVLSAYLPAIAGENEISSVLGVISSSVEFETRYLLISHVEQLNIAESGTNQLIQNIQVDPLSSVFLSIGSIVPSLHTELISFAAGDAAIAFGAFAAGETALSAQFQSQIQTAIGQLTGGVYRHDSVGSLIRRAIWSISAFRTASRDSVEAWNVGRWIYGHRFWHFILYFKVSANGAIIGHTAQSQILSEISSISFNFRYSLKAILVKHFSESESESILQSLAFELSILERPVSTLILQQYYFDFIWHLNDWDDFYITFLEISERVVFGCSCSYPNELVVSQISIYRLGQYLTDMIQSASWNERHFIYHVAQIRVSSAKCHKIAKN